MTTRRSSLCVACLCGFALAVAPSAVRAQAQTLLNSIGERFEHDDPEGAAPIVAELEAVARDAPDTHYAAAYLAFLQGDWTRAATGFGLAAEGSGHVATEARALRTLAEQTGSVTRGMRPHLVAGGRFVVWLNPGPDEVLLPYMDEVLSQSFDKLTVVLRYVPKAAITVHVYPRVEDLARVSNLTEAEIRNSGTIALCKFNRLMITSPQDMVYGYDWADTVSHELVHFLLLKRAGQHMPIWLHEGFARSLEGLWRGDDGKTLDAYEQDALARARKASKFISFEQMSPSMAKLPTQDDTALAFAEVHSVFVHLRSTREEAVIDQLVASLADGATDREAIQAITGRNFNDFQVAWRRWVGEIKLERIAQVPERKLLFRDRDRAAEAFRDLGSAVTHHVQIGDRLLERKRLLAASKEYAKALAAGGEAGPSVPARLARVLIDLGQPRKALDALRPALARHEDFVLLHLYEGRARLRVGEHEAALTALTRAVRINPYDPDVHGHLAEAYQALGRTDEAQRERGLERLVADGAPPQ